MIEALYMCFTRHPSPLARSTRSECVVAANASPTTYVECGVWGSFNGPEQKRRRERAESSERE
jgi:hypothetical protein